MSASGMHACSLGPISCVTVTAPDLDVVAKAYARFFDYAVVDRSPLDARLASAWRAPALAGRPTLILAPAAGDECVFRFIEDEPDPDFVPFATFGWNAAEILVENVDALADQLVQSDFRIVGEPANLSFSEDIRAMQVIGPGEELLYLTEFKKQLPGLDVPLTRCPVDRVFIVILGGPSMDALQDFYAEQFGVPRADPVESRVKGMSAAFGNSPDHKYPIAALPLNGRNLIEVDEMPRAAKPRSARDGHLPAGIAMVSFMGGAPGVFIGPAGELIEVVARG